MQAFEQELAWLQVLAQGLDLEHGPGLALERVLAQVPRYTLVQAFEQELAQVRALAQGPCLGRLEQAFVS